MTLQIASISACILLSSSLAAGQSRPSPADQPAGTTVTNHTYAGRTPSRVVSTRSSSGGLDVTTDIVESPNIEGRLSPTQETVTQKTATAAGERRVVEVLVFGPDGRRRLLEATESQREVLPSGDATAIHNTVTHDVNGRSAPASRTVEQLRASTPGLRQIETVVSLPHPNAALAEYARTEEIERRPDPRTIRYDATQYVRDVNGRWQPIEMRQREAQETATTERVEEQAIQRVDINGRLTPIERTLTRGSSAGARDEQVIERYIPVLDPVPASGSSLALGERVTRTTTKNADGSSDVVEEVEGRNLAAPADPMRIVRRTVTTTRPVGTDRWVTTRQVFERDVNGRMQPVSMDDEESSSR